MTQTPTGTQQATGTQPTLFKLGMEEISVAELRTMPSDEQRILTILAPVIKDERFWQAYRHLRMKGFKPYKSAAGAWIAAGNLGRGKLATQQAFAAALGRSRRWMVRCCADEALTEVTLVLTMSWWSARIPDLDQSLYIKALAGDVSAIKLGFQRARVPLSGEDSKANPNWMDALRAATEEVAEETLAQSTEKKANE